MPQIIPRQFTQAPTNITPGYGMAIGQGLQAVAGVLNQVEKGRRQADELEMKMREQQEKNAAEVAYNEKHRARLHAEQEIVQNYDPMEYIDALDKWERDYDSKLLSGKSQVFTDSFSTYDRQAKVYGLNRMSSDMQRKLLDNNIATFELSVNNATTVEELQQAINLGREKGLSERLLNATMDQESKRIEEDHIYAALNSGDSNTAKSILSESTLDERRKREIGNAIDAEVNRAERERMVAQLEGVTETDNMVIDMLAGGSSYDEAKRFIESRETPGTWGYSLSMNALQSRVSKPESKLQDTMDRFTEYQNKINAEAAEILMSDGGSESIYEEIKSRTEEGTLERDMMMSFAKRFVDEPEKISPAMAPAMVMAEQIENNESLDSIAITIEATDPTKPERFFAEATFKRLTGYDYNEWSNMSRIQKSKIQTDMFTEQLDRISYDITSYISENKADNYSKLDTATLDLKMQSMARIGSEIRHAYDSGLIDQKSYGELNSKFIKRVIDTSHAAQGKSGRASESLPFTHLQPMIDSTYNNLDIPAPVLQKYREIVYTELAGRGTDVLSIQDNAVRARQVAEQFSHQALDMAYKSYGLSDDQIRAEMKQVSPMYLSSPMDEAMEYFMTPDSEGRTGVDKGIATQENMLNYIKQSGLGFTDEETRVFIESYRNLVRGSGNESIPNPVISTGLNMISMPAEFIAETLVTAFGQSGQARQDWLEQFGLEYMSNPDDEGN